MSEVKHIVRNPKSYGAPIAPVALVAFVVCKTDADVAPAKKLVESQGGKVVHTYNVFPGFDVLMPKDSVTTFENSEHIESVEIDKEMKTQ